MKSLKPFDILEREREREQYLIKISFNFDAKNEKGSEEKYTNSDNLIKTNKEKKVYKYRKKVDCNKKRVCLLVVKNKSKEKNLQNKKRYDNISARKRELGKR